MMPDPATVSDPCPIIELPYVGALNASDATHLIARMTTKQWVTRMHRNGALVESAEGFEFITDPAPRRVKSQELTVARCTK
jgi:hypothetical protein